MVTLKDGRTIRKKYDISDKLKFSTLEKKLFFKSKSLLGKRISKKLWYDSCFDNSLPSNWLEKNLKYQINLSNFLMILLFFGACVYTAAILCEE